jgi:hypothetical protein
MPLHTTPSRRLRSRRRTEAVRPGSRPSRPSHRLRTAVTGGVLAVLTATAIPASGGAEPSAVASEAVPLGDSPTFAASYLNGFTGPQPAQTVGLAGTWDFTPVQHTVCTPTGTQGTGTGPMDCHHLPALEPPSTIQVPGGGWVKQGWTNLSIGLYEREIHVPDIDGPQVTKLAFGAINHRATLWVGDRKVGTQLTSYTPSVFDISGFVEPGRSYRIKLRVEGRKALVGPDGRYTVPEGASWSDDVAQGIFRSADLQVFPAVHISDTVVRTSVVDRTLSYDVELTNATATDRRVRLDGGLSSWNGSGWQYPKLPQPAVTVPAHATRTVTVGPVGWVAGPGSYWWPNVPYRPGYRAQLHELRLGLTTPQSAVLPSRSRVRFGFREIDQVGDHFKLNGVKVNFRGDSLQGANYDNIDYHGRGDAYDTYPGFLQPSEGNGGWPKAVDNYLRLNYSGVRIHQIPATPYMLDVADELGLMIQDETAIRGSNNRENFIIGRDNMIKHLADLVKRDRNHASVLRWSQANEPFVAHFAENPGAGNEFDEALYQTVMRLDSTRPISTDHAVDDPAWDLPHDNYTMFCHYDDGIFPAPYTESICQAPEGKPRGQGEFVWPDDNTAQGATWFATASMRMREKGASDTRPYTLLDLWCSFIPGVKRTDMSVEWLYPAQHPLYGEDNLPDPWTNPTIHLIQQAFNPVAVIDTDFWNANKLSNEAGQWPTTAATVSPGTTTRTLSAFNDTFAGTDLAITWRLHLGSATGSVVDADTLATQIPLGGHRELPITLDIPDTVQPLHLEVEVHKPGEGLLYRDANTVYSVQAPN